MTRVATPQAGAAEPWAILRSATSQRSDTPGFGGAVSGARSRRARAMGSTPDYPPIGDYALIGNSRAAALVSRDGSIDWLCLPRFDSPSMFAALLDAQAGGCFRIRPTEPYEAERRYLPATNILETTFRTARGTCLLRDLMPVASEEEKRAALMPEHQVLREIEALAGEVELEVRYKPRPMPVPAQRSSGAGRWACGARLARRPSSFAASCR